MKQWYALRSKPKKEAWVASLLSRIDIEVYLPHLAAVQQRGRNMPPEPFFPGYLFGRLDPLLGELDLVRYTSGVLHIVGYGGEPWPVPDELVLALKKRLVRAELLRPLPEFRPGEKLLITEGPLKGVEALFDRQLTASGRAQVFIRVLHRFCRAEVQLGQLRQGKAARHALG